MTTLTHEDHRTLAQRRPVIARAQREQAAFVRIPPAAWRVVLKVAAAEMARQQKRVA